VKVVKKKVAPPQQAEFDIMYAEGISLTRCSSTSDRNPGSSTSCAWYSYQGQPSVRAENAKRCLKQPDDDGGDRGKGEVVLGIKTGETPVEWRSPRSSASRFRGVPRIWFDGSEQGWRRVLGRGLFSEELGPVPHVLRGLSRPLSVLGDGGYSDLTRVVRFPRDRVRYSAVL